MQKRLNRYARLIGVHRSYRPVKDIDYESYALFMSTVAHDHKSLGPDKFLENIDEYLETLAYPLLKRPGNGPCHSETGEESMVSFRLCMKEDFQNKNMSFSPTWAEAPLWVTGR